MAIIKQVTILVLATVALASCNSQPKKVSEVRVPVVYRAPYDTLTDNIAAFISGMPHGKIGCLAAADSGSVWKKFSFSMDSGFADLDTARFLKMRTWADSELLHRKTEKTLFYPFGGPDLLNANIFYPNAGSYILIGLEPVGQLPDICRMNNDQVSKYLNEVWFSLKDIFKRSYFITGNMIGALKKTGINGSVPLMALFLKRQGYHIVSLKYIGVDSTGNWQPADSLKGRKDVTGGVRIEFVGDTGRRIQSAFYFQTDISDEGLRKNHGFSKYLSRLPESHTYLKAASFLMHGKDFSRIRNTVFEKSSTILQDDSGIAYAFFDKKIWDIHLYGKYMKPGKEFSWINETDLAKAYNDPSIKPVPFTLGYNWRTRAINLLYAVRK
ncbi:MAG TPA: hypothetical protein VMT63_07595 [Bacteroidales bacterium]|nr:hypothetical protein [Bacteroidales bacterium]